MTLTYHLSGHLGRSRHAYILLRPPTQPPLGRPPPTRPLTLTNPPINLRQDDPSLPSARPLSNTENQPLIGKLTSPRCPGTLIKHCLAAVTRYLTGYSIIQSSGSPDTFIVIPPLPTTLNGLLFTFLFSFSVFPRGGIFFFPAVL